MEAFFIAALVVFGLTWLAFFALAILCIIDAWSDLHGGL